MRPTILLVLALLAAAPSGCGAKHIRDCGGGLEIQVFVPVADLGAAESLYVLVGIDGSEQYWDNTWSAAELDDNGFGDLVLHIPLEEPTRLTIRGELRGAGDVVLASETVPFIMQPLNSGCQPVTLGMGGAGRDGSVVDAEDLIDAEQPADACTDQGNCPADAGGPPDSFELIDGAPNDCDSDLVPDADDNCFCIPNTDQNDEDGDGLGDRCDNCPIDANDDQLNTDPDEPGDACDPHFNQLGWTDYIHWMDGFGGGTNTISGYAFFGAAWVKTGGKAQNPTSVGTTAMQIPIFVGDADDELRVYAMATVTSLPDNLGTRGAGVTISTKADMSTGWRCLGRMTTDILVIDNLSDNSTLGSMGGFTTGPGTTQPIFFQSYKNDLFSARNLYCTYGISVNTLQNDPQPPIGVSAGLTVSGAVAEFDYLFVIQSHRDNIIEPMDGGP